MKKLLFFLVLNIVSVTVSAQLNKDLFAHWTLDGHADDSSGNGFDGTMTGSFYQVSGPKPSTCALAFAKEREGLLVSTLPPEPRLPNNLFWMQRYKTTTFSLSLWFKPISYERASFLSFFADDLLIKEFGYERDSVFIKVDTIAVKARFDASKWNFVVFIVSYDGSSHIFLNQSLVYSSVNAFSKLNQQNFISRTRLDTYLGGSGSVYMEDIRIYDRFISVTDVKELYALPGSCYITGLIQDRKKSEKEVMKAFDLLGREIFNLSDYQGMAILVYTDGSRTKVLMKD